MKTALKILSIEHKNILKIIKVLLKECDSLESGNKINKDLFKKTIDFIRGYADKFHHAKEEDILFAELGKDKVQMHCNPIPQMLYEHDLGRNFIRELENGVKKNNKNKIIKNAREYAKLLQDHISKEDNILYPMADEALNQNVKNKMLKKFKLVEEKLFKEKQKHLLFLKKLKNTIQNGLKK
ncbi:hemerythrin [bacterium]|nr:hemerythrin [bacterium]|tara:strand:+ start:22227 stop:22772 length:546 start_codon:yes stop_codon:yes gene_type:complete